MTDPVNAASVARRLAEVFSQLDPESSEHFRANLEMPTGFCASLASSSADIAAWAGGANAQTSTPSAAAARAAQAAG